jgi:hypothetical protein
MPAALVVGTTGTRPAREDMGSGRLVGVPDLRLGAAIA